MSFPGGSVGLENLAGLRDFFVQLGLSLFLSGNWTCLRVTFSSLYYILLGREGPSVFGQFQGVPVAILNCFLLVLKIFQFGWNISLTFRITWYFASPCTFYVLRSFSSKWKVLILGEIATQQCFPTHICAHHTNKYIQHMYTAHYRHNKSHMSKKQEMPISGVDT